MYVFLDSFGAVPGAIQHLTRVQTRVVRAVSWSLLFRVCSSLRDVLDATLWCYNTTFVSCYLGVVDLRLLDVSSLVPFVAAGSVGVVSWMRLTWLEVLCFYGCGRVVAGQTSCGP